MRLVATVLLAIGPCVASPPEGWRETKSPRKGVEVFEYADEKLPLTATCVRVDPKKSKLVPRVLLEPELATVARQAREARAFVAINAGYFGGGRSLSLVVQDGVIVSRPPQSLTRDGKSYPAARGAFGVRENGELEIVWPWLEGDKLSALDAPLANRRSSPAKPPRDAEPWPVKTAVGAGPVLVVKGKASVSYEEEVFFGSGIGAPDSRQPRSAIGVDEEGRILLIAVEGRSEESRGVTLEELAETLVAFGAVRALNLDGGGSVDLVLEGARVAGLDPNREPRAVASVLAFVPRR